MDAQVLKTSALQATGEFCTFAIHEIHALAPRKDGFGVDRPWYEALIRPHGLHRHWSPSDFIDRLYLERPALETDLEVLDRMGRWLLAQDRPMRVSINTHPQSLASRRFVDRVLAIQERARNASQSLCLELIEFGVSREKQALVKNAQELRRAGVLIALDDFGSRINCFDLCASGIVDLLKIHINFIRNVHRDPHQRAIVESISTLGRGLGASVIAEGVEYGDQAEALRAVGIEYAQGFLFQKPKMLEVCQ